MTRAREFLKSAARQTGPLQRKVFSGCFATESSFFSPHSAHPLHMLNRLLRRLKLRLGHGRLSRSSP